MTSTYQHPLDNLIDKSLPLEEKEVLTDFIIKLRYQLPKKDERMPEFGYVVENGHVTELGLSFNIDSLNKTYLPIINEIPGTINQLTKLRYLNLRGNNIRFLHPSLVQLKNLETLDLEGNPISEFPLFLLELTKLKHLYLKNTGILLPEKIMNYFINLEIFEVEWFHN